MKAFLSIYILQKYIYYYIYIILNDKPKKNKEIKEEKIIKLNKYVTHDQILIKLNIIYFLFFILKIDNKK